MKVGRLKSGKKREFQERVGELCFYNALLYNVLGYSSEAIRDSPARHLLGEQRCIAERSMGGTQGRARALFAPRCIKCVLQESEAPLYRAHRELG